jgi:micrococcal nuclease
MQNPKKAIFSILALVVAFCAGFSVANLWRQPIKDQISPRVVKPAVIPVSNQSAVVTKVLDGDTIIIQGGIHVRLLGIDADEPDYPCHQAAKTRLEELIQDKTVKLETDNEDLDQYGRQLRYVFIGGKNINEQLVVEGLAIARFYPENQKYKDQITAAESAAMSNKIGCKWQQH